MNLRGFVWGSRWPSGGVADSGCTDLLQALYLMRVCPETFQLSPPFGLYGVCTSTVIFWATCLLPAQCQAHLTRRCGSTASNGSIPRTNSSGSSKLGTGTCCSRSSLAPYGLQNQSWLSSLDSRAIRGRHGSGSTAPGRGATPSLIT